MITNSVVKSITSRARPIVDKILARIPSHIQHKDVGKVYLRTTYPAEWDAACQELESAQPLLKLCAGHWKAEFVLAQVIKSTKRVKKGRLTTAPVMTVSRLASSEPDATNTTASRPASPEPDAANTTTSRPASPGPDAANTITSHPTSPETNAANTTTSHPASSKPDTINTTATHPSFPRLIATNTTASHPASLELDAMNTTATGAHPDTETQIMTISGLIPKKRKHGDSNDNDTD
jgi:hypothetical protein